MNKSELSRKILSDIIVYSKYAKYLPKLKRRETWEEITTRNKEMHIRKFPLLAEEIEKAYKFVYEKKVLPSLRSMQFAGKPIELNPSRLFNCAFLPIDDYHAFSEIMFLLLGGSGVGFSVQSHHVEKLPVIHKPIKKRRMLISDSIEGWSDAIKFLFRAYMDGKPLPIFDFRDIRPKGALLVTAGGKAPGPEPLRTCLYNIQKVLDRKEEGSKLTPLEAHDLACFISDAVLAGGIRRSAMLSLFSFDDEDMLSAKTGDWFELHPYRARANNSVAILRHRIKEKEFKKLWHKIELSRSGEPGIVFSNNKEMGYNPCGEAGLRSFSFCNLTEVNASNIEDQNDLNQRCAAAAFIGTLQASYTDFHYLREEWQKNTEKDALLGVSMTGICSGNVLKMDLGQAAGVCVEENRRVAKLIGIRPAARVTLGKPSGTSSIVLGCSSGIHEYHDKFYIRRIRLGKNESLYKYLVKACPDLIEDDVFKPSTQAVLSVPQSAPEGAIVRSESTPIQLLERVKKFAVEWVNPGHIRGDNKHSISCTISLTNGYWEEAGDWLWKNREHYSTVSVLPIDDHVYAQMPFESCAEEQYEKMLRKVKDVDLTQIIEEEDNTEQRAEPSCAGGACTVTHV